ncbi:hypothetical protein JCM18237_10320 [Halorubrum luteum]
MAGITAVELAFRLFVASIVIVGPTVLFIALWRFLLWLRDDALIDTLVTREVLDEEPSPSAADVLAAASAPHPGSRRCPSCDTRLLPGARRCRECGDRL